MSDYSKENNIKRHKDVNEIEMSPYLSTNSTGQLELKAKQNFL